MSDSNLHRFNINQDEDDHNLSSFLPGFLVKKIEKDDGSKLCKQNLFMDEDNEEEALEIKMDHYFVEESGQNSWPKKSIFTPPKKSHSQKHITDFPEEKHELTKCPPFFPKNRRPQNMENMNPNIPNQYQQTFQKFNPNQFQNQPNFQNQQNFQNQPNFQPFNNNYNYNNMNTITNNMNNLNISYGNNQNYSDFSSNQQQQQNNSYQTSDAFYAFEQHSSIDSLNNSNISLDEGSNFFMLRPTPKKTHSDKNLKINKNVETGMKSLFKEKIDLSSSEEINLTEILANLLFDIAEYIKTQKGSRIMQKELNAISPENLENLLLRICPHLTGIMVDTYGNYFSQRLIQCCSPQQRLQILNAIIKDFIMISCHNSGTHSIQCLMEIINTKEEEEIIKFSIQNDILKLSYDNNGTHVIQKVIAIVEENDRNYINQVLLENLLKLVFDPNGICVIKKLINGNKDPEIRVKILSLIQKNCLEIIQNAFGNYIIQHILDEWGPEICKDVTKVIQQNIISLSMQKFSSNVVEKCMDIIDFNTRNLWIKDIFNFSKISSLLKNKYGNFVLQKAIMIMTPQEKREIKEYLVKKIGLISNKEKARLKGLIEIIN
jgi:hypothetical protein